MSAFVSRFASIQRGGARAAKRQIGVTIIELMISLLLSMLIMGGVVYVFFGSRQTYSSSDAEARMQENSRIALEIMSRDLRMAGYTGCRRFGSVSLTASHLNDVTSSPRSELPTDDASSTTSWIRAAQHVATDVAGASGVTGSDVITMRRLNEREYVLTTDAAFAAPLTFASSPSAAGPDFKEGDTVVLSDCNFALVFNVSSVSSTGTTVTVGHDLVGTSGQTRNWNANLNPILPDKGFNKNARVSSLFAVSYYVADTGRKSATGESIKALYSAVSGSSANELVEGVENLRVDFGVDANADGTVDEFYAPASVTDWSTVVSARIELLLATLTSGVATQSQPYTFGGNSVVSSDTRLRMSVSTTVSLRNRTPD